MVVELPNDVLKLAELFGTVVVPKLNALLLLLVGGIVFVVVNPPKKLF